MNEYQAPKLRVQKSIENNGGANGATSFNVDYKIVATNDGSLAANTGKLTDKPDFAKGRRSSPAKIARDPGWPGHRGRRDRYRRRLHADRRRRARCRGHQGILDPLLGDPQPRGRRILGSRPGLLRRR